ncbi:MEDS domain-containing protein [Rhizobium tubonense]|uniref:MEDS domain-containing protein n=1 Tax=Rhizobium tubonense TaxID=484088 RepID=A0A2W4EQU9_9HYPH|nr:MEDS domain-containing protein [Rhizobium tubonense]PZM15806.1 hypothetical protein CPY51_05745 [Rhizobium tubonense]
MGTASPIRLAGHRLGRNRHVCAFCNSAEEGYRVLMPFIKEGFECGDKALHIINPANSADHMSRLGAAGIDTEAAMHSGQLELRENTEFYQPDGHFDQDRMFETFKSVADAETTGGFPLSRIVCHMDWAASDTVNIVDVIEFEARVNDVWQSHDDAVICVYDLAKFGGDAIVDIMRTHPMIIVGGLLQENPFYVAPKDFLSELRERRASPENPQQS